MVFTLTVDNFAFIASIALLVFVIPVFIDVAPAANAWLDSAIYSTFSFKVFAPSDNLLTPGIKALDFVANEFTPSATLLAPSLVSCVPCVNSFI